VDFKFLFRSFVEHTRRLLSKRLIRVVERTLDGAKRNVGVSRLLEILLEFPFSPIIVRVRLVLCQGLVFTLHV